MQDFRFLEGIQKMAIFWHSDSSPEVPKKEKKIFEAKELMGKPGCQKLPFLGCPPEI